MENFSSPKTHPNEPSLPESFSPGDIFRKSFRFTVYRRSSWIFGLLLSLPAFTLLFFSRSEAFSHSLVNGNLNAPMLSAFFFLLLLLFLAGESGLILLYDPAKRPSAMLSRIAALGAIGRWYFFFLLALLSLFSILFLPSVIFPGSEESINVLRILGIVFFVPLCALLFLIKNFGVFYLLISRLGLKDSALQAYELFLQKKSFSFIAFALVTLTSTLMSFLLQGILQIIPTPFSVAPLSVVGVFLYTILSLFGNIFIQSLWYFSFEKIAGSRPEDWQKEKEMVQKEMVSVGEI